MRVKLLRDVTLVIPAGSVVAVMEDGGTYSWRPELKAVVAVEDADPVVELAAGTELVEGQVYDVVYTVEHGYRSAGAERNLKGWKFLYVSSGWDGPVAAFMHVRDDGGYWGKRKTLRLRDIKLITKKEAA